MREEAKNPEVHATFKSMTNKELAAIYVSLEDFHPLKRKVYTIMYNRGVTATGIRKYHQI